MPLTSSIYNSSLFLPIVEQSQVGDARRRAVEASLHLGFDETKRGELAIVVTELATNLVKHARSGILIFNTYPSLGEFEIIAADKGPGIPDMERALNDGFSTTGTLGAGFGAIRRFSSSFDCYSDGSGTVVAVRLSMDDAPKRGVADVYSVAGIAVPKPGELVCGDSWATMSSDDVITLVVADGLGHGIQAADASGAAVAAIGSAPSDSPATLLERVHRALKNTRGSAVAVAQIFPQRRQLRFAGLGNIAGVICNETTRQVLISHDGTAGYEAMRIRQYSHDLPASGMLVLSSDGCSNRWDVSAYPGIVRHNAATVCGALFRQAFRRNDDATMVVMKL